MCVYDVVQASKIRDLVDFASFPPLGVNGHSDPEWQQF